MHPSFGTPLPSSHYSEFEGSRIPLPHSLTQISIFPLTSPPTHLNPDSILQLVQPSLSFIFPSSHSSGPVIGFTASLFPLPQIKLQKDYSNDLP